MIIYLTIASLYASKPSKIPRDPKVGKELYEQYCSGCHGQVKQENDNKENDNKENDNKENDNNDMNSEFENERIKESKTQNINKHRSQSKEIQPNGLDTLSIFSKQSLSSPIALKGQREVPSLLENSYSENEWMKWVLVGEGMMPGYSEVIHATDAIKIKVYLDGL